MSIDQICKEVNRGKLPEGIAYKYNEVLALTLSEVEGKPIFYRISPHEGCFDCHYHKLAAGIHTCYCEEEHETI